MLNSVSFRTNSLVVQLTLVVVLTTLVSFLSSVLISTSSVKTSFEQELYLKNVDNAASLALLLSQMDKDPVEMELLISATFDTGHYQLIEMQDPNGVTLVRREYSGGEIASSPVWFNRLITFDVGPGVAQVSDGWQQYATLYLKSHVDYTKESLWESTLRLTLGFMVVGLVAGLLTLWLMAKVMRPLKNVVAQAKAFGEKRFIKSEVPATQEFSAVVSSMNQLAERFSGMMADTNKRLNAIKYHAEHDDETLLARRDYFLKGLTVQLENYVQGANPVLILFRLENLEEISKNTGRATCIKQLREFSRNLLTFYERLENRDAGSQVGRLNHTDFAVYLADMANPDLLDEHIKHLLAEHTEQYPQSAFRARFGAVSIESEDTCSSLLSRADKFLNVEGESQVEESQFREHSKADIESALAQRNFSVSWQPVTLFNNEVIQYQMNLILQLGEQQHQYGYYAPLLAKNDLFSVYDWSVLRYLLEQLVSGEVTQETAIELSAQTLTDDVALASMFTYLSIQPELVSKMCFEVTESVAVEFAGQWSEFCRQAKMLGARLALKRAGSQITEIDRLQELGLDYVKIDAALVRNLSAVPSRQSYLREFCSLAQALGIKVLAHSGASPEDEEVLKQLGFAGRVQSMGEDSEGKQG